MAVHDPVNQPTDESLLQRLASGETNALGTLYDRYASLVYRLALKILKNAQEAEDLTQEIFLSLIQKNNYDAKRGKLSTYLLTMTHSRAIDRLRAQTRRTAILHRWQPPPGPETRSSPVEQASLQEIAIQVRRELAQIPAEQRRAIELAYYEGLTQKEIATVLELPLGTVKTRVRQGLRKLRNTLGHYVG